MFGALLALHVLLVGLVLIVYLGVGAPPAGTVEDFSPLVYVFVVLFAVISFAVLPLRHAWGSPYR